MGNSKLYKNLFRYALTMALFVSIGACNELSIRDASLTTPTCNNLLPFDGGDGTIANPYQVCSKAHLANINSYLSSYFIQTFDIDATEADCLTLAPIGSASATAFSGSYDGQNHTIKNFCYHNAGAAFPVGLFSIVSGTVNNIVMTNSSVQGNSMVGGVIGEFLGTIVAGVQTMSLSNLSANGAVTGAGDVGGVIGTMFLGGACNPQKNQTLQFATSSGTVTSTGVNSGGIVGLVSCGQISNSSSSATVSSTTSFVGGLVGKFTTVVGDIDHSFATGNVSGSGGDIGGLVGSAIATIIDTTYATGTVTENAAGSFIGGLVGSFTSADLSNSYATGNINAAGAASYVGGLVGFVTGSANGGNVTNCYATGNLTSPIASSTGGLLGSFNDASRGLTVSNSYAHGNVNGVNMVGGLVGKLIATANVTDSYATGTVSGTNDVGGLLGYVSGGPSTITGSYATGNVTGTNTGAGATGIGGLLGFLTGVVTVSNSYANGNVIGTSSAGTNAVTGVGGLVGNLLGGNATYSYTISSSYATGDVTAIKIGNVDSYGTGGLIGSVGAPMGVNIALSVSNTFATGDVVADDFVGGLIGDIAHTVGTISDSFAYTNTLAGGLGSMNTFALVGAPDGLTYTNNYYRARFDPMYTDANGTSLSDAQFAAIGNFAGFSTGGGNPWKAAVPAGQAYPSLSWCNNNIGCD